MWEVGVARVVGLWQLRRREAVDGCVKLFFRWYLRIHSECICVAFELG
jgi:hypothetical protein